MLNLVIMANNGQKATTIYILYYLIMSNIQTPDHFNNLKHGRSRVIEVKYDMLIIYILGSYVTWYNLMNYYNQSELWNIEVWHMHIKATDQFNKTT